MSAVATLSENIAAYEKMQNLLEADLSGNWVVFYNGKLEGDFHSFQDAAEFAVERWGRGPYLIRRVGRAVFTLPASVQYRRVDANS